MRILLAFLLGGFAGWLLENVHGPRYSHAFGKTNKVPFLPVYGAGAVAIVLAAPLLDTRPWWLRFLAYAAGLSALEFGACALDRQMGKQSWCYEPGQCRELRGCVSVPHAVVWGILGLGADAVVRSFDARPLAAPAPTAPRVPAFGVSGARRPDPAHGPRDRRRLQPLRARVPRRSRMVLRGRR
jgi:hypothetical protein